MIWAIEDIEFNFCQTLEIFLFLQSIHASSGAHPVSYSVSIRREAAGFIYCQIKNEWSCTHTPPYAFVAHTGTVIC
jgi:hypothetical protein